MWMVTFLSAFAAIRATRVEPGLAAGRLLHRSRRLSPESRADHLAAGIRRGSSPAQARTRGARCPGRRHSRRAQKARPKFPHATATKVTVTGNPQVTVFAPGFS